MTEPLVLRELNENTCSDANIPSWKIIEHCCGQLESKEIDQIKNELFRRYWIKT